MALYSPASQPTPRIIITKPDEQQLLLVPWDRNCLAALWVSQFFWLLVGTAMGPSEPPDYSWSTLVLLLVALGNLIMASTLFIEAHRYAIGTLTPEFFLKLQKCKTGWVLGGTVITIMAQLSSKTGLGVLPTVMIDVLYLLPFAAGSLYARVVMKRMNDGDEDPESGRMDLKDLEVHNRSHEISQSKLVPIYSVVFNSTLLPGRVCQAAYRSSLSRA
ncbi:uncharacterized protein L3040_003474 [Drepanopeziza brunnea f. sp. 'multigermtubi']|uniref:uncharacterized protein n=1 Tax=Drepanopeziza brunnea f. sp. 'multigermtubi' TaxID=698441 RepID=UPI0023A46CE1|nr:hypothetical protein L3040_003474 [Drepanopeziza brunnea f. sp. 'multigermtubi']